MIISQRLIVLGLAFSLLGSTCAFAKPMPEKEAVAKLFSDGKNIRRDRLCASSVSQYG